MGVIVKITCASCKREWQCQKGCGILHGQLENVRSLFPQEIKNKLENYEAETKFPFFDFEYQLASCEHCKAIESVPVIRLAEQKAEYAGVCEECGQKAELIKNLKKTRCPSCGECTLLEEEMGMWD